MVSPFGGGGAGIELSSTSLLEPPTDVAVVPLPAGGLMLLTALGGIAVAKRRWKKAKA
ncbi:MAG: VPLPA-CTERM sorting domain-containing protein [Candidatus Hydrothermarchaeales archaeon]